MKFINAVYAQGYSDPSGHTPATIKDLEVIFEKVLTIALELAGIVLFIMLMVGGFKYITSGGDPKGTEGAKHTITYAILGIIFLILSIVILQVIEKITGAQILNFQITF